jgi:hypothetical protein
MFVTASNRNCPKYEPKSKNKENFAVTVPSESTPLTASEQISAISTGELCLLVLASYS